MKQHISELYLNSIGMEMKKNSYLKVETKNFTFTMFSWFNWEKEIKSNFSIFTLV